MMRSLLTDAVGEVVVPFGARARECALAFQRESRLTRDLHLLHVTCAYPLNLTILHER